MTRYEFAPVPDHVATAAKAVGIAPWTLAMRRALPEPAVPPAPITAPSDLSDQEWADLRGIFPAQTARRNARNWRRVVDSVLYLKNTSTRWTNLPKRYGAPAAQRKACEAAAVSGLWVTLLERIDNGELAGLAPERLRQLRTIAADWTRRGERYHRQRV